MSVNPQDLKRPIAITMGDPAGVGPEVLLQAMTDSGPDSALDAGIPWILVGADWALQNAAATLGRSLPPLQRISAADQAQAGWNLLDLGLAKPRDFRYGEVQADCGELAVRAVEWAATGCLSGELAAMVTAPINKEAIHAAGYVDDIGHQEILARLAGVSQTATMLMTPGLRVVHLSTHKSLAQAVRFVTKDEVLGKLHLIHTTLSQWGLSNPRIAVAALNPHGGEGGLLGREEIEELAPAVDLAQQAGIQAVGPLPADSVFNRAIAGEFDVVLALYHDQGHIAIKVHNFHESTTATLGIPMVRTSVDHGTAFDIAGQGVADATGMRAAMAAAQAIVSSNLGDLG
jgi:4-hydroxythreonine-4-phosphate dehydrogenase